MDEHIDHSLLKRREKHKGIYVAAVTLEIKDVVLRLLSALQSPIESCVLGKGLVYSVGFDYAVSRYFGLGGFLKLMEKVALV